MDILSILLGRNQGGESLVKIDPAESLVFDGDTAGKETCVSEEANFSLVKISDKVYDLTRFTGLWVYIRDRGKEEKLNAFTISIPNATGITDESGAIYGISYNGNEDEELSAVGLSAGTWVFFNENAYISRIELSEVVHPIKEKYLGGVALPVVEIKEPISKEGATLTLTNDERSQLYKAYLVDAPLVLKFTINMGNGEDVLLTWYQVVLNKGSTVVEGMKEALYHGETNMVELKNYRINIMGAYDMWDASIYPVS